MPFRVGADDRARSAPPVRCPPRAPTHPSLSIELVPRLGRRLLDPDSAHADVRACVALTLHLDACEAAQHRELAGVRERIGDATLEDDAGVVPERCPSRELGIE